MSKSIRSMTAALSVLGTLLIGGWLALMFGLMAHNDASAGFSPAQTADKRQGNTEQGRKLFNGKGICYYCHGIDGDLAQRPELNPRTQEIIDRLKPKPANLRDPSNLKLMTDNELFRLIREGHVETGMFPDTVLTDEEIKDILAYLFELRCKRLCKAHPSNDDLKSVR